MKSGFFKLNTIQFLAAINENVFKLLCAYFLIDLIGVTKSSQIMAIIGALFILPFLLFSSVGGILADKCSKSRVTLATRFLELLCLVFAAILFSQKVVWSPYVLLLIMATLSALFGPSKYGIIPELLPKERLLYGNGLIACFTYLGIIIGTTLASLILWATKENFTVAILCIIAIALSGFLISLFLPRTPIENADKPIRFFIYVELWEGLKQMWQIPFLFSAFFAYCYFLFIGAFVQLNSIPYVVEILHFKDIYGGYIFLFSSLGLGIGAYLMSRYSTENLLLVPFSGTAISIILCLFFFFPHPWWLVIVWMVLLGFFGGVFIVPPQTFIMKASPEQDRGRNFATANFFSFAFALLASLALYTLNTLFLFSPDTSFLIIGIINFLVIIPLYKKYT